jgi:lipopolysaccharide export system permease protein
MLPAVLLYVIYLVVLNAARGAVEDGKISTALGLWWVHALFLFIALLLLLIPVVRQKVRQRTKLRIKQRARKNKAVEVMT